MLPLVPEQPGLQPVEIDIDDWRRIEGKNLRQSEAADDGVAERLTDLRSDPRAEHHRHGTEHRRHRGHEDRTEALDAGLVDQFLGRQTFILFGLQGEVHEHDAVFLDDADEQDDTDDCNHAQIVMSRHQQ